MNQRNLLFDDEQTETCFVLWDLILSQMFAELPLNHRLDLKMNETPRNHRTGGTIWL